MRSPSDLSISVVAVVMDRVVASHENITKEPVVLIFAIKESEEALLIIEVISWEYEEIVVHCHLVLVSIDSHVDVFIILFLMTRDNHETTVFIVVVVHALDHTHHQLIAKAFWSVYQGGSCVIDGWILLRLVGVLGCPSTILVFQTDLDRVHCCTLPEELLFWHINPSDIVFIRVFNALDVVGTIVSITLLRLISHVERDGLLGDLLCFCKLFD